MRTKEVSNKRGSTFLRVLSLGIIAFAILFLSPQITGNITGYVISDVDSSIPNIIGIILFIVGLFVAYFSFRNNS